MNEWMDGQTDRQVASHRYRQKEKYIFLNRVPKEVAI
jgi:hypothetical protein